MRLFPNFHPHSRTDTGIILTKFRIIVRRKQIASKAEILSGFPALVKVT